MKYIGQKLSKIDPLEASIATAANGWVVIEDSGASPEEFAEWYLEYNYTLSPGIWCTDRTHSDLFWRVTNNFVDNENKGLFGSDELDWHSDLVPHIDAQEVVGLYAKTITYPTETWVCSSTAYWNTLDENTKDFYKKLTVVLYNKGIKDNDAVPFNRLFNVDWDTAYSETVVKGIRHNREISQIKNCINLEPDIRDKFKNNRGHMAEHKFVSNHPLGFKSLFFQPYELSQFKLDGNVLSDGEKIYQNIWNDLVMSDKYTYKHVWKQGDILLMDQISTIHRRPKVSSDLKRELLRAAGWYKSSVRNHFEYVL